MASGDGDGFGRSYLRGLHAAALGNAPAYGYSVMITSTFGVLSAVEGTPTVARIFAFAAGAIAGFAVIEAVASGGFRHGLTDEPSRVKAIGSSVSILSVGGTLGLAFAISLLFEGFAAWTLAFFVATISYLCLFALELGLVELIRRKRNDDS